MKKLLFIFNPKAGKSRIPGRLSEVVDYYTKAGYIVTVYPTQSQGDCARYIEELEENYEYIVCSGGDGTLNEMISGYLLGNKKARLGYLPFGSTNDFGRSLGIPLDFDAALSNSINGTDFAVDVGKVNERFFVYVAAFGIFTDIPYVTSQKLKNTFGYMAYVLEGIKAITDLKSYLLEIEYDGKVERGEFIVGMVTNTMSVGGFKYPMNSNIRFNDGMFEVLLIRMPKSLMDLQAIIQTLLHEKVDERYVLFFQTSQLKIRSERMAWTFDGEYGGVYEELELVNLESAVSLKIPYLLAEGQLI